MEQEEAVPPGEAKSYWKRLARLPTKKFYAATEEKKRTWKLSDEGAGDGGSSADAVLYPGTTLRLDNVDYILLNMDSEAVESVWGKEGKTALEASEGADEGGTHPYAGIGFKNGYKQVPMKTFHRVCQNSYAWQGHNKAELAAQSELVSDHRQKMFDTLAVKFFAMEASFELPVGERWIFKEGTQPEHLREAVLRHDEEYWAWEKRGPEIFKLLTGNLPLWNQKVFRTEGQKSMVPDLLTF